jgi:hypothetical protein
MPIFGKWVCLWPYMGTTRVFGVTKTELALKNNHSPTTVM